jgi:hypothetical protein
MGLGTGELLELELFFDQVEKMNTPMIQNAFGILFIFYVIPCVYLWRIVYHNRSFQNSLLVS